MLGRHMYAYMSALCIIACKTSSKSYCGCFQSIQYIILSQRQRVCVVVCVQKRFPSAAVNVLQFIRRTRHPSAHVSAPWFTRRMIYESVGETRGLRGMSSHLETSLSEPRQLLSRSSVRWLTANIGASKIFFLCCVFSDYSKQPVKCFSECVATLLIWGDVFRVAVASSYVTHFQKNSVGFANMGFTLMKPDF